MTRALDALTEIRRLYYGTTKATILRDLERAIDLLKSLPTERERETVAVYMDGLAQLRSEWGVTGAVAPGRATQTAGTAKTGRRPAAKRSRS